MMKVHSNSSSHIKSLISAFDLEDGARRQSARQALVQIGKATIPFLLEHLEDRNGQIRWEIAKTLEEMKDSSTAPTLVGLLSDDVPGIRWLAGEGLINLKEDAIIPLLKGMQIHFDSKFFREGAHHVLREFDRQGILNKKTREALEALEGAAPGVSAAIVASEALQSLS